MSRRLGPTITRWQLGEELQRLRRAARRTEAQVAEELGCSESKIKKLEAGYVGVVRSELLAMLTMYGVTDPARRAELVELQKLGRQRGWWAAYGPVPNPFATFLGLEDAAQGMRVFEPLAVHGLLQTEDYARALTRAWTVGASEEQAERQAALRMERQQRYFSRGGTLWVILDEAAVRRAVGGPDVMRAQIDHLWDHPLGDAVTVQVIPFSQGAHPGMAGAYTLFEFEPGVRTPVVYVESQAGNIYMERESDLHRCSVAFDHMRAAALSPLESVKHMRSRAWEMR